MVEKVIFLENISLVDFLGVENKNIREIVNAFPESKIISRGNEIHIKGSMPEVFRINDMLHALLAHYHKYNKITQETVQNYIKEEKEHYIKEEKEHVILYGTKGIVIKPRSTNQKKLIEGVSKKDMAFVIGPAGTGKTYISVALAVKALKSKEAKKIILTRPVVEAGESLGFLPGDLKEKIDPYLRPVYDALGDMISPEKLKYYQENNIIEIAPLAYMRGRTLHNAFVILDEAQNTTPLQMKMFLTRMGTNSKFVINGDITQIDPPPHNQSGLLEAIHILKHAKDIAFIHLTPKDIVRHKLVKSIIEAYEKKNNT